MRFNLNITEIQFEILDLLVGKNGMYGLEMVKASHKLKRATIYVHLSRMEDKKWLRSEAIETGEPGMARRRYYVTGEGLRIYRAARAAFVAASLFRSLAPLLDSFRGTIRTAGMNVHRQISSYGLP